MRKLRLLKLGRFRLNGVMGCIPIKRNFDVVYGGGGGGGHLDIQNTFLCHLDTQKFKGQDLLMMTILEDSACLQYEQSSYWPKKAKSVYVYISFISLVVFKLCTTPWTPKSL